MVKVTIIWPNCEMMLTKFYDKLCHHYTWPVIDIGLCDQLHHGSHNIPENHSLGWLISTTVIHMISHILNGTLCLIQSKCRPCSVQNDEAQHPDSSRGPCWPSLLVSGQTGLEMTQQRPEKKMTIYIMGSISHEKYSNMRVLKYDTRTVENGHYKSERTVNWKSLSTAFKKHLINFWELNYRIWNNHDVKCKQITRPWFPTWLQSRVIYMSKSVCISMFCITRTKRQEITLSRYVLIATSTSFTVGLFMICRSSARFNVHKKVGWVYVAKCVVSKAGYEVNTHKAC